MLKPENRLQWKGTPPPPSPKAGAVPAKGLQLPNSPRPKGMPTNAIPQAQYTLDQLKKMAASRGISVEKLLAQMAPPWQAA